MDRVYVTVDLPRSILSTFRKEPQEFVQEMRLAAAVKWYELGQVSQAKAAEIAGISRAEFLDALRRFGVSPFQETMEEIIHEVRENYEP
ncbi:MAG: UPF0175 family protein [Caldilineae bacterium]|nr:MAG: UPF0175 family protein [Caldilineae bacterium]